MKSDRFLGIDHGASRSAADVASPPRSTSKIAARGYATPAEISAGHLCFTIGKLSVVEQLQMAARIYRENGQTGSAVALEQAAARAIDIAFDPAMLDPYR